MRRTLSYRDRLVLSSCVAAGLALAAPGMVGDARAQAPGPESFVKPPETPLELWELADYLVRTGQVQHAVPYLNKFMASQPDDATLLEIRDRYGAGSVLRLDDHPETRALAGPLSDMLAAAARRNATRAERIERFIAALTRSRDEQAYAVERLREAGPYAVPFLVQALDRPNIPPGDRALIAYNLGRLDRSAVPALLAVLDSSDPRLAADAALALGAIGDVRAVPLLTYHAAPAARSPIARAARRAVADLTGRPFEKQPRSPVRVLADEARRYHLHLVRFPGDRVVVWQWDEAEKLPVPREVSRSEAEAFFGQRLAHEALRLDPADRAAQVVLLSQALEKAVERAGFAALLQGDPTGTFTTALAAGPDVLGQVVRTALADGKMDLAAAAVTALGQVADRELAASGGARVNPLIEALSAPGRRVQFAAARALVLLEPRRPFAGSSRVVPILARFVSNEAAPRAVVIDGNAARGGQLVGFLRELGYDPRLAATGREGFLAAAERADVELILVDSHMTEGTWRLLDTLANLRSDARTAGIPLYIVGTLSQQAALDSTMVNYPGVKFLVTPTSATLLEQQLGGRPADLTDAERSGYAQEAAVLLAQIASRPGSPFESDLVRAQDGLTIGLNVPTTSVAASSAMGDVPSAEAQRGLADVALDPSKDPRARLVAAAQLTRSLQRFGPLVTADQEARFVAALDQEADPALRAALSTIVGALRPTPALVGRRLQQFNALTVPLNPEQANPAPDAAPSPAAPEAPTPAPAEAATPPADANP
jgi:CheY-like chemotaxis protein